MKKVIERRAFLKSSLISSISLVVLPSLLNFRNKEIKYLLDLGVASKLFDGKKCWCHPRAGIIPRHGENANPKIVMTMNVLDLEGSDVFRGIFGLHTNNLGESWTEPILNQPLAPPAMKPLKVLFDQLRLAIFGQNGISHRVHC